MAQEGWITIAVGGAIAIISSILTAIVNYRLAERAAKRQREHELEDAGRAREQTLADERRQYRRALEERDAETVLKFLEQAIEDVQHTIRGLPIHRFGYDPEAQIACIDERISLSGATSRQSAHAQTIALAMSAGVARAFTKFAAVLAEFTEDYLNQVEIVQRPTTTEDNVLVAQEALRSAEAPVLAAAGDLRREIKDYLATGEW